MDNELIREVNEAMQRDQILAAAKRHGKTVMAVIIAGAAAAVGWYFYQQQELEAHGEATRRLTEGREFFIAGKYDDARKLFSDLAGETDVQHAAEAYLWQAKSELALGREPQALDALANVVSQKKANASFVALACLQARIITAADERFASCTPGPFAGLKAEVDSMQAIAQNKPDDAARLLPTENITDGQKSRLSDVSSYLAQKVEKPAANLPAASPEAPKTDVKTDAKADEVPHE